MKCNHACTQVQEKLSQIRRDLASLPTSMSREAIAEYVRKCLQQMFRQLYDITHSTDVGGIGDKYTANFKLHYTALGR
jgi:hypothetical protein